MRAALRVGGKEQMGDEEEEAEEVGKTSATEKEAKQKKGGAGVGLLPFTLVSPMLVSLIVIVAIKIFQNRKKKQQPNFDRSKTS